MKIRSSLGTTKNHALETLPCSALAVPHYASLITSHGSVDEIAKWAGAFKDVGKKE